MWWTAALIRSTGLAAHIRRRCAAERRTVLARIGTDARLRGSLHETAMVADIDALRAHEAPLLGPSPNPPTAGCEAAARPPVSWEYGPDYGHTSDYEGFFHRRDQAWRSAPRLTTEGLLGTLSLAVVSLAGRLAAEAPVHALIVDNLFGANGG
jgi:hypothetical protein